MAGGGVSEDGDVGFQIAPMVDVVFVLLLFFMASAGSQVLERELNISLPSGQSGQSSGVPSTPILVEITANGDVIVNNKSYGTSKELVELRTWIRETIERFGDKDPFIIQPTPETKHERIMDVLNAAAAAGVKNLTFS
ncbi:MAG: ExbD/TolR family protein [Chthoniobacterales bacterium]